MKQHRLVLQGGSADRLRIPIELLLEMLGAVRDGVRHAAQFYANGHQPQVNLDEGASGHLQPQRTQRLTIGLQLGQALRQLLEAVAGPNRETAGPPLGC